MMAKQNLIVLAICLFFFCTDKNNTKNSQKKKDDFTIKDDVFTSIYIAENGKDTLKAYEQNINTIFIEVIKHKEYRNYLLDHINSTNGEKYQNDKGYIFWRKRNKFSWMLKDSIIISGYRFFKEPLK